MKSNKEIRIGIFVDGDFIPSHDGASNRFHYLSRHLAQRGIKVVIFHGYRGWSDISLIKKEPFKTYVFNSDTYYSNLELIASLVRKEGINILQFDNLEPLLLQGKRLAEMTGAHLVSELHYVVSILAKSFGASEKRLVEIAQMEKAVAEIADHVIFLSNDDKKVLAPTMQLPASRMSVVPSGVDVKELSFYGPSMSARKIIFLGNLFFEPNANAVRNMRLHMYEPLRTAGFTFVIAGKYPESLKSECKAPGFSFVGLVKDLNTLFNDATFALAPIEEGTGMRIKLLNYLAAGIPVIATQKAVQGFSHPGCVVIENDCAAYPSRILSLYAQEKSLFAHAMKGREVVTDEFDWKEIARRTALVYEHVLSKPPRAKQSTYVCTAKEPAWLEDALKNGWFKTIDNPELPKKFSYVVIDQGKLTTYQLQKLIALEGMPGAGKSTTIGHLLKKNPHLVTFGQTEVPKRLEKNKDNLQLAALFLREEIKKGQWLEKMARTQEVIVLDRTFMSTLAYAYARSKTERVPAEYAFFMREFFRIIEHAPLTWPTHTLYLDISVEESLRRRAAYAHLPQYRNWFNPSFLRHFRDFYESLSENVGISPVRIRTEGVDPLDVKHVTETYMYGK